MFLDSDYFDFAPLREDFMDEPEQNWLEVCEWLKPEHEIVKVV